jgi:O-antigen/teichoic acid export membrane protein
MQKTYTKNYFKIYFWQGVSMVLNFISMFVVIPYLTTDPVTYGIYSICISFSIFLAYADFGFMLAGQKYAAEYFAKGDTNSEIRVVGFTIFILSFFLLLFSITFIILSLQPQLIVKGITNIQQGNIAKYLLLFLAIFTPTTLLQRLSQMIYGIRMEDFIVQRINIIGSIVKISSVLWFFSEGKYNIIGYFLSTQFINLIVAFIALIIARRRYNYNFLILFKSFNFNKEVYKKTKNLAFASLFITISWILYYELDSIAIGKLFGPKMVAIYAIGLTVLSFFRSILGIVFAPFNVRFNHFIGIHDEISLKSFYLQIVIFLAPFVIFPIIIISIFSKPIVLSWVGSNYLSSVPILQFLVFCNFFAFITYPTNFMLIAKEHQKQLYFINVFLPFIFWFGVFLSIESLGILSFAIFKLIAFLFSAVVLFKLMVNYLELSFFESLNKIFRPMSWAISFLLISCFLIKNYLPHEKSKINLIIVGVICIAILATSFLVLFFTSISFNKQIKNNLKLINEN